MLPIHASWQPVLAPVEKQITQLLEGDILPPRDEVLRAFQDPFDAVKVLIVGQDPYPTPGHAMGLSFSAHPGVRPLPRSLGNIFKELHSDLDIPLPTDGDLSPWAKQGVLLLNRVLTVRPGAAGSHRGQGWEEITEIAIRALAARDHALVSILWGRDAQTAARFLGDHPRIESPHPSPLSASRGFFGSRPFSRTNDILRDAGEEPVDWRL